MLNSSFLLFNSLKRFLSLSVIMHTSIWNISLWVQQDSLKKLIAFMIRWHFIAVTLFVYTHFNNILIVSKKTCNTLGKRGYGNGKINVKIHSSISVRTFCTDKDGGNDGTKHLSICYYYPCIFYIRYQSSTLRFYLHIQA